ncbi:MAG: MoaD/ThiS family protein [Ardenticatenaceae bacterium]|nr:MoaD/ThiS family protein [Ardenticatenaceae bacterium]MCB9444693.1 MoaD/ThiS family protein [Ardenticatenaceae bacterium]
MNVSVRLSGDLAQQVGTARLQVTLAENAIVADLAAYLRQQYPAAEAWIDIAVPIIAGQHVSPTAKLAAGQEVALLLPVAGG